MRVALWLACGVALSACSTQPRNAAIPPPPAPVGAADTCGSAPYTYLIGEKATALERVLILRQVRVIWPEATVSGDSKPERINFYITQNATIGSITCG